MVMIFHKIQLINSIKSTTDISKTKPIYYLLQFPRCFSKINHMGKKWNLRLKEVFSYENIFAVLLKMEQ